MTRASCFSILALLAAGCGPQTATVSVGDYTAYLAATNSLTVNRGKVKMAEYDSYHTVDCREFETARNPRENEALRLEDRMRICDGDSNDQWPPEHEIWLEQNGYHVFSDQLEPWRGEAVVTSEGDVQLTFHQRLLGGDDFRFAIVVDPEFQPVACEQTESGDVAFAEVDGNWLEHWSEGLPAGTTRYFVNSGSYQFNPVDTDGRRWFLPLEWQAAHAEGKFGDDFMRVRSTRYAVPEAYIRNESQFDEADANVTEADLLWCEFDLGDDANESRCMDAQVERAHDISDTVLDELTLTGVPENAALPSPAPVVHDNSWRVPDGRFAGFDGWVDLVYSWIEFDPGSELEQGGAASGRFNMMFDGRDSQSRIHVRGEFDVKTFRRTAWGVRYLPEEKLEENGTVLCGQGFSSDD